MARVTFKHPQMRRSTQLFFTMKSLEASSKPFVKVSLITSVYITTLINEFKFPMFQRISESMSSTIYQKISRLESTTAGRALIMMSCTRWWCRLAGILFMRTSTSRWWVKLFLLSGSSRDTRDLIVNTSVKHLKLCIISWRTKIADNYNEKLACETFMINHSLAYYMWRWRQVEGQKRSSIFRFRKRTFSTTSTKIFTGVYWRSASSVTWDRRRTLRAWMR